MTQYCFLTINIVQIHSVFIDAKEESLRLAKQVNQDQFRSKSSITGMKQTNLLQLAIYSKPSPKDVKSPELDTPSALQEREMLQPTFPMLHATSCA